MVVYTKCLISQLKKELVKIIISTSSIWQGKWKRFTQKSQTVTLAPHRYFSQHTI